MSEEIVKTLLESLSQEQKQQLVQDLLSEIRGVSSNQKTSEQGPSMVVKEDFTVVRPDASNGRKSQVRAGKNQWVDDGSDRDADFDPELFEKIGKTPRTRSAQRKVEVSCHVCGKKFSMNQNLIYGENLRCDRCVGR